MRCRTSRRGLGTWLATIAAVVSLSACNRVAVDPAVGETSDSLWVAYAPTRFDPTFGIFPTDADILEDLRVLHAEGFRGIATYASDGTLHRIPQLARHVGFTLVYMGVYCPSSAPEIAAAIAAAEHVDAYVVGNEGLGDVRAACAYDTLQLESAMQSIAAATGKPVTTSEQIDDYLSGPWAAWLLQHCDWIFANAHPYWAGVTSPDAAVDWTAVKHTELQRRTARRVVLRETGLPSAGCVTCSEENQRAFYAGLAQRPVAFFHFEAFDQTWKTTHPVEPHWGLNTHDRRPKLVVR